MNLFNAPACRFRKVLSVRTFLAPIQLVAKSLFDVFRRHIAQVDGTISNFLN